MKLARAVEDYIERKQSAGCKYTSPGRILRSFSRQLGNVALASIVPAQVSAFLNGPRTGVPTWRCKHGTLRVFFEYWALRGRVKTSPLPPNVPKCPSIFVPHIYSHAELHRLLDATAISQRGRSCVMDARTFRTLLLFLYGTGMRLGEAVKLKCGEVDLNTGVITVRDTKFYKSRLVPRSETHLCSPSADCLVQTRSRCATPTPRALNISGACRAEVNTEIPNHDA